MLLKNQLDSIYKVHIIDVGCLTLLKMSYILPPQHAKINTFCITLESAGQPADQCKQLHCSIEANIHCWILD